MHPVATLLCILKALTPDQIRDPKVITLSCFNFTRKKRLSIPDKNIILIENRNASPTPNLRLKERLKQF